MEDNKNPNPNPQGNDNNDDKGEKTYTLAEVEAMMADARKKAKDDADKQAKADIDAKIAEADKLRKMSADEQYQYQLQQREQLIAEKEKQLALAENKSVALGILAEKHLSTTLIDFVVAEDAETMKSRIDALDVAFKASVAAEVERRLSNGGTPKKGITDDGTITKEAFAKMTYSDKVALKQQNPTLYQQLRG